MLIDNSIRIGVVEYTGKECDIIKSKLSAFGKSFDMWDDEVFGIASVDSVLDEMLMELDNLDEESEAEEYEELSDAISEMEDLLNYMDSDYDYVVFKK